MDEDDFDRSIVRATPARPIDWLIVAVDLARSLTETVAGALSNAEMLLCGHANHQTDKATFMEEARRQIETMTEE